MFFSLLASCSQEKSQDILRLAITDKVPSLDPVDAYDSISLNILGNIYETLYQYHYTDRPYRIEPLLAEAMPVISANQKKYTINIRKGIKYHSKEYLEYVTAHDFIHQFKRIAFQSNQSNGWWLFDGKIKGINHFRKEVGQELEKIYTTDIEGLKAINDYQLQIELTEPYPQLIYALAMTFTAPIPPSICKSNDNNFQKLIFGTGPYQLDHHDLTSSLTLKRNQNYRPLPAIEKVHYSIMEQSQTRWLNFLSNKLHMTGLGKDQIPLALNEDGSLREELNQKGIQLHQTNSLTYWWISFNMEDSLLGSNLKIRKAIAHALDREKILKIFTQNSGVLANSIFPPSIIGHKEDFSVQYSPEKAISLLNQAGFNHEKPLEVNFDLRSNDTTARQFAEFIQSALEKVGVKVKIHLNRFSHFLEKARKGNLQIWLDGWTLDYPDPENTLQLLYSKNHPPGVNATYYHNQQFDLIFENLEAEKIEQQLRTVQKIVFNDLPWVPLYYSTIQVLTHPQLKNYQPSDLINNHLKYLKLGD